MTKTIPYRNYWGRLGQFEVPHSIIQEDGLRLKGNTLAILLVLFEAAKAQQRSRRIKADHVDVTIEHETICKRSGFSKNMIGPAIKELESQSFIRTDRHREKRGEFAVSRYIICDPVPGSPLLSPKGSNFLLANKVQYIKIPVCVVRERAAEWSLARMSTSALRMFVAICWQANRRNRADFNATVPELRKLAGLSTLKNARQAIDELAERGLIWHWADIMQLRDPYTGEPADVQEVEPENDPWNYSTTTAKGRAKRWIPITGGPEEVEQLLKACGAEPVLQRDGEYKILCPFHNDRNPSCSVNPKKRCFLCFGCPATGSLISLVMKLRGSDKGEAIRFLAERAGQLTEFHEPDKHATKYPYYDADGKLIKEVLRYPGKEFRQRRRVGVGWAWNVDGIGPMLYNLPRLKYSNVVCVCEGEKDCNNLMELSLYDTSGEQVSATTSGNAESWRDHLADDLKGKKVILMPDADDAGKRYGAAVEASLKSRDIEYRVVSFKDAGAKDVSDFVANGGTSEGIERRVGRDWIRASEPSYLDRDDDEVDAPKVTP